MAGNGRIPPDRRGPGDPRPRRAAGWLLAGAAVAGLLAVAWWQGWLGRRTDPRVAEILALQQEATARYAAQGGPTTFTEAVAAVTAMNQIRERTAALPENLRPQVEQAGGDMFRTAMRARIDGYFAQPPEKREQELDRQIDQEELFRKALEAGRAVAGVLGGNAAAAGGNAAAAGSNAAAGQAGGGQANAGGRPAGAGPPRGGTEEDRNRLAEGADRPHDARAAGPVRGVPPGHRSAPRRAGPAGLVGWAVRPARSPHGCRTRSACSKRRCNWPVTWATSSARSRSATCPAADAWWAAPDRCC